MHLLGILYGVFLVLLSLAPVYLAFRIFQLVRQIVADAAAKMASAIAAIRKRIDAATVAIAEAKQALLAAGREAEPLEAALAQLIEASGQVERFSSKIATLTSESIKLLKQVAVPIPAEFHPDCVKLKWHTLLGIPVVVGVTISPPFTFKDLSLSDAERGLEVAGLKEAKAGFEQLGTISTELGEVLTILGNPKNLTHLRQAVADLAHAGKVIESIVDLAQIEAEIAYIKKTFAAMIGLYRPKALAIAWLTGAVVAAVYLNWAVLNVTQAVRLIFG